MSKNEQTVKYQVGPGFLGILTLIFITLKLTGHIGIGTMMHRGRPTAQ